MKTPALRNWLNHHRSSFIASLKSVSQRPLSTLVTVVVIAISLSLPTLLLHFSHSAKTAVKDMNYNASISLFLKSYVTTQEQNDLAKKLLSVDAIEHINIITPEQGLKEFAEYAGISDLSNTLPENPLPPVIEIFPTDISKATIQNLIQQFEQLNYVEMVRSDIQWVERLTALLTLVNRTVLILLGFLLTLVFLTVFNTIRLIIENKKQDLQIIKLMGATNAYISRPFLYMGLWYGLLSAMLAVLFCLMAMALIRTPLTQLFTHLGMQINVDSLTSLNLAYFWGLSLMSVLFAVCSAAASSFWHLRRFN